MVAVLNLNFETIGTKVREALLRRHRHLYEKNKENSAAKLPIIRSLADIGRNYSTSRSEYPDFVSVLTVDYRHAQIVYDDMCARLVYSWSTVIYN